LNEVPPPRRRRVTLIERLAADPAENAPVRVDADGQAGDDEQQHDRPKHSPPLHEAPPSPSGKSKQNSVTIAESPAFISAATYSRRPTITVAPNTCAPPSDRASSWRQTSAPVAGSTQTIRPGTDTA